MRKGGDGVEFSYILTGLVCASSDISGFRGWEFLKDRFAWKYNMSLMRDYTLQSFGAIRGNLH